MGFVDNSKWVQLIEVEPDDFQPDSILMRVLSTIIVLVVLLVLRRQLSRYVRGLENIPQDERRRWLVRLRNGILLILLVSIIVVWAQALRGVAVYVFAVAVATVIALKELIQCLTGSIARTLNRPFKIGDRIEIGDYRGDVIDMNLLSTTIMEIGPGEKTHRLTGRSITLPNSMFLTKPIINECYTDAFVLHVFTVPMKMEDDWDQAEKDLLEAARYQSASYIESARAHFNKLSRREGLVVLSVDPHVTFRVPSAGTVDLVVRMAAPSREKGKIEQAILRHLMMRIRQRAAEKNQQESNAASNGVDVARTETPQSFVTANSTFGD